MVRRRRRFLFAGLLVLAAVGCGGDPEPAFHTTPAPPGSRQPDLSGTEDGLLLSWVEGGSASPTLRYARLSGRHWSEARTITSNEYLLSNWAHVPAVIMLGEGRMAASWPSGRQREERAIDIAFSSSRDGVSWSKAVRPDLRTGVAQHGWVALVPEGASGVGLVSLEGGAGGRSNATRLLYRIASDSAFEPPRELDARVCPWCQPSAVRVGEDLLVAYRGRTDDQVRDLLVVRRVGGQWRAPERVHDDGWRIASCPVNGPALVAHDGYVALAWFTAAGSEPRVLLARDADGSGFGDPLRLDSGDPLGRVDAVMLPDRTVYVSWLEKTETGAQVQVRSISPSGTPGEARTLGHTAAGPESGFPRMAHANGRLYVAWVEPSLERVRLTSFRL